MNTPRSMFSQLLFCGAALTLTSGCTATLTARTPARTRVVYEEPVVYVEQAPVRVYEHPYVYHHGRRVYLIEDRWYYPSDRGWAYFRVEPRELRKARLERRYTVEERESTRRYVDRKQPRRRYIESPRQDRRRRHD